MTLCPTLASDRAVNGVEGERRRLFDKLAAKGYSSHMVTISCKTDNTHGNARRRQNFKAFMSMKENTCPPDGQNVVTFLRNDSSSNVFLASGMFCTEGNTGRPNLLPQHLWCDPRTELCDKCPRSYDGPRHWTAGQQSAQQTSSYEVVADIIESLLAGTQIIKKKQDQLNIVHMTLYDGNFEVGVIKSMSEGKIPRTAVFAISPSPDIHTYAKKNRVQNYIQKVLQAWLRETHLK